MRLAGEGALGRPGTGPCPPAAAAAAMAGFMSICSCAIWNIEAKSPPPGAPAPGKPPGKTPGRPPPLVDVGTPRAPRRGFCGMRKNFVKLRSFGIIHALSVIRNKLTYSEFISDIP